MTAATTKNQFAVNAKCICKKYDNRSVVDQLSFVINEGEFCGILGPNGAGKTTVLRMLVGHSPANSGELTVLGYKIPEQARRMRSQVGIVPQMDNLDVDFTVKENLLVYGRYFGLTEDYIKQRIPELLASAALQDYAEKRINELSGGMRRRLSIVRALINQPKLIILDEPTTGLDPHARQIIWQQLRRLQKDGITLILTTHYMEEAERLCDRIILMDQGQILADQTPQKLIETHIEAHVLEVHGPNIEDWRQTVSQNKTIRFEHIGDTSFYYGLNLQILVKTLDAWPGLRYLYRPANLEDVFLKLTGRELRDE